MIDIKISTCGDHWLNPEEVIKQILATHPNEPIVLNLGSEGVSLRALGIIDIVTQTCDQQSRELESVSVKSWPNLVENVPFQRVDNHRISHFFWMSDRYRDTPMASPTNQHLFAVFVGRRTWPRMRIAYDMQSMLGQRCLISMMKHGPYDSPYGINLDSEHIWGNNEDFLRWYADPQTHSIDGHDFRDQYDTELNTHADILAHYHKFGIEIVCEAHTRGTCFFPTEKTVRPLIAGKPIMVYGPRGFLSQLRDLGFKTWNDLWDESYDELEGISRWIAMRSQISRLANCLDSVPNMALDIAEHNRIQARRLADQYRPQ